jgi:hypothetical protein
MADTDLILTAIDATGTAALRQTSTMYRSRPWQGILPTPGPSPTMVSFFSPLAELFAEFSVVIN